MCKTESNPIMSTRRIQFGLFSAVFLGLSLASGAFAQPAPAPIPAPTFPFDVRSKIPGNRFFANAVKNGELPKDDELTAMDAYIVSYSLPRLTLAENLTGLPEMRDRIRGEFSKAPNGTGPAVERFNKLAMTTLSAMLHPRYQHKPVVRVNIVLLIGELDQVVGKKVGVAPRKAVPYAPASLLLAKWTRLAAIDDYLKAAALRGVLRHARAGIPTANKAVVTAAMTALRAAPKPANRSANVHAWMQRRAGDVLAAMQ
jgi:hypothetical protein